MENVESIKEQSDEEKNDVKEEKKLASNRVPRKIKKNNFQTNEMLQIGARNSVKPGLNLPQIMPADLTGAISRVIKNTPKIELGETKLGVKEKRDKSVIMRRQNIANHPRNFDFPIGESIKPRIVSNRKPRRVI